MNPPVAVHTRGLLGANGAGKTIFARLVKASVARVAIP